MIQHEPHVSHCRYAAPRCCHSSIICTQSKEQTSTSCDTHFLNQVARHTINELAKTGMRGCGCCCCLCLLTAAVVCCGGGREPKCSTTISCPSEEARRHLFSDQCTVPGADGGVGSLFIFMWIQNTQPHYPELHWAACLPPLPPAPYNVAVPTFTFLTRAAAAGRGSDDNGMQ